MFREKMVTSAIPERVYVLCKIVEKGPISGSELREKMEPAELNANTSTVYFPDYRAAAEELGLIITSDNMISLAVDPSVIESRQTMRKYVNGVLRKFSDGLFYQVTHAYYMLGADALKTEKNLSNLGPLMSELTGQKVDAMDMRAWRFWVSYLGLGYLQKMFMIPNADVFLQDVIELAGLEKGKKYSFGEFINRISPYCGIIMDENLKNRRLSYGMSNGLRTLHDAGILKMEHFLDQKDIWTLYPLSVHPIRDTVTNITIGGK